MLSGMMLKIKFSLCLAFLAALIANSADAFYRPLFQRRQAAPRKSMRQNAAAKTTSSPPAQTISAQVSYEKDIRPILEASCFSCHAGARAMGQLRLDTQTLAMKGGISGPAIVAGKGQESRLVHRLLGSGDEARMPMGGDPLSPAQIELITKWIDQGARWSDDGNGAATSIAKTSATDQLPRHWAYVRPVRPSLPSVANAAWVRNSIDNFVLARLEKEKLAPSSEAARETLARRVSLDLTGLPPSLKEVADFVADKSPDAYEKMVDRLLSSPHYGERWARPWLDMARYADTNGYEKDRRRSIWKYRDWVIDALNRDLPFDQFTVESTLR